MSRARFLIDECLTVELPGLAWARGFQGSHLRELGLLRLKDSQLAPVIFGGDWCFVTNNARDFRGAGTASGRPGLYAGVGLHAGLVCIQGPAAGLAKLEQKEAFAVALDQIELLGGDATNLLVEVDWAADRIAFSVAEVPPAAG